MTTREILGRHDKFLDSLIDGYEEQLDPLLSAAQKRTLKSIEKQLTVDAAGNIEHTPANQRVLRSIDRIFRIEMNRLTKASPGGYKGLANAFTDQFADHLPQFQDVLSEINASLKGPPLPEVKFTGADVDLFVAQATGAKDMLIDVLDQTANAAKRQALFSVGGLKFSDLAGELADQFGKTKAQAVSTADTAISSFYRTIANQSYKKIEAGLPKGAVAYEYAGPSDNLERDFCANLTDAKASYTRDQIDDMDNGQGMPVWTSCGGWRCRHQWVMSSSNGDEA